MIKIIIKRSGTEEDFSPEKPNGWGVWAAKSLGTSVDWGSVVLDTVIKLPEKATSKQLQYGLIDTCLGRRTWEYNRMAGRLLVPMMDKEFYGDKKPTIRDLHSTLFVAGLMVYLNYSPEEYAECEKIINHKRDLKYPHFQLNQIRNKYALRDKITGKEYETPQFVYMRMAMALAENEPKEDRLRHISAWYKYFSQNKLNAPTPNFVNLGTKLDGYASCCVYTTDDTWRSLAAGDHIAYAMTCMSAGIGTHIKTRSLDDPIRGGLIKHQGKLPYYRALVGAIGANLQNGRGGAATVFFSAYDPEVEVIQKLKNPMTPQSKRIAGCHYAFVSNRTFARLAAKNKEYATYSYKGNEEMFEAMYHKDQSKYESLYAEYLKNAPASSKKNARDILVNSLTEVLETGVQYLWFPDAANAHTPFIDPIVQSNLCTEISIPSKPYASIKDLYKPVWEEGDGEIGLCSLAATVVSNIESDEEQADVSYYALKMIDVCIHKSQYEFPSLEYTAKARLSAGVGIMGLAHLMAKHGKKYDTQDGRNFIHEVFETHMWHLINASLRLGKELGNAPWIHKTLWPQGWTPLSTYEKSVDELVTVENKRDWAALSKEIIENGGIRNSVVATHMPGESSSQSSGTSNSIYPIRSLDIMKTNDTTVTYWVAPDATKLASKYQSAYDIATRDMIKVYAIAQKWTDQGISADLYQNILGDDKVSATDLVQQYLDMVKYGLKSRYYVNSNTSKAIDLNKEESAIQQPVNEPVLDTYCEGCAL